MLKELFNRGKSAGKPVRIPESLQPANPVNYNSVLDYLVGLSPEEFKKMTKSAEIYRKADEQVAGLIGVENEPTTTIKNETPELTDDDLDDLLVADPKDLQSAFLETGPEAPKVKKPQSTDKKIEVKE